MPVVRTARLAVCDMLARRAERGVLMGKFVSHVRGSVVLLDGWGTGVQLHAEVVFLMQHVGGMLVGMPANG
ncbi:hypothetical protein GCM10009678_93530 [Actinomadura kijaniata]